MSAEGYKASVASGGEACGPLRVMAGKAGQPIHFVGEKFGQKSPPLSIIIKQILERYPDGQIFKVSDLIAVGRSLLKTFTEMWRVL